MARLQLVDISKAFDELKTPPVIANHIPLETEEDQKAFNDLIYTHYDGESLKLTPSCECGELSAGFNVGEICPQCRTECKPRYSGSVDSIIWIIPPEGVPCFIAPGVWNMMTNAYRAGGVDVIRWICDPHYHAPKQLPDVLQKYIARGHKRGYNYFIENFEQILYEFSFKTNGNIIAKYEEIYTLLHTEKDKVFCKALPVPSKMVLVLEKSQSGRFFDKSLLPVIDAVLIASELGHAPMNLPISRIESKTVTIISKLGEFFKTYTRKILTGKKGIFRKHYYAGRLHFTARQVITSLFEPHQIDELILPWTATVKLFTEHLRSKLMKPPHNLNFNDINDLIRLASTSYHPLIDQLLEEIIIKDTPYKGFPCLFARPPILDRGSVQFFYITQYMKDPEINVIRISPLAITAPNADFDGDQMQLTLLLDKRMHDGFLKLKPEFTILDKDEPNAISGILKMPAPVINTVNNWFSESDELLMQYEEIYL